jgi:hypothetical protein
LKLLIGVMPESEPDGELIRYPSITHLKVVWQVSRPAVYEDSPEAREVRRLVGVKDLMNGLLTIHPQGAARRFRACAVPFFFLKNGEPSSQVQTFSFIPLQSRQKAAL